MTVGTSDHKRIHEDAPLGQKFSQNAARSWQKLAPDPPLGKLWRARIYSGRRPRALSETGVVLARAYVFFIMERRGDADAGRFEGFGEPGTLRVDFAAALRVAGQPGRAWVDAACFPLVRKVRNSFFNSLEVL